jgi:hypothetical protein
MSAGLSSPLAGALVSLDIVNLYAIIYQWVTLGRWQRAGVETWKNGAIIRNPKAHGTRFNIGCEACRERENAQNKTIFFLRNEATKRLKTKGRGRKQSQTNPT